jgi:hypothetical protein
VRSRNHGDFDVLLCRRECASSSSSTAAPASSSPAASSSSSSCATHQMQPRPFDALGIEIARAGKFALFQALARKLHGAKHIDKIAGDIMNVIRDYTNLYAHTTTFFNAHGIEELRVCVKGVVPTTFKGNVYKTPITIWISSRYPDRPPEFYVDVSDATGMMVPTGHLCVAKDGQVRPPATVSSPPRFCSDCSYSPAGRASSHADVGVLPCTRPQVTDISAANPANPSSFDIPFSHPLPPSSVLSSAR